MILRSALLTLSLLAFAAAPVFANGVSAGVGDGGVGAVSSGGTRVASQAFTASTATPVADCEKALRGFVGRNTIQPSVRKQALRACQEDSTSEDWAARTR